MKCPSYMVFMVQVPKRMGFADTSPGELFFLRFEDLFNMFNLKWIQHTLVRLVGLYSVAQVIREESPVVA
jgi:hypothetical protein